MLRWQYYQIKTLALIHITVLDDTVDRLDLVKLADSEILEPNTIDGGNLHVIVEMSSYQK